MAQESTQEQPNHQDPTTQRQYNLADHQRQYSLADQLCIGANNALQTLFGNPPRTDRPNPADKVSEQALDPQQQQHIAGLMRINHCGEVCAQALYQGQALTAKLPEVRQQMEQAAIEENDHLHWCQTRLQQLDSHSSYLNGFWYIGSFTLGAVAGWAGDQWSLGFVAETEYQVVAHLDGHLQQLPDNDHKSRAILQQMRIDEQEHATSALAAGGRELPGSIKWAMKNMARVMTRLSYRI